MARIWTLASKRFLLRPELESGNHLVEVFGTDAAGKAQLLKREWMSASAFAGRGFPNGVETASGSPAMRLRVRVDGVFLASAP